MKKKKKLLLFICILLLISSVVVYFYYIDKNKGKDKINFDKYSEELSDFFNIDERTNIYYKGYDDYNMIVEIPHKNIDKDMIEYVVNGFCFSNNNINEEGINNFEIKYIINHNCVREIFTSVTNGKTFESLNSIIPNQILLQVPLENNNIWFQEFEYNGEKYKAETTLKKIEDKNMYVTQLVVKDIKGFPDNTYKEIRVYEKDKGMTVFKQTPTLDYLKQYNKDKDFLFSYGLISIQKNNNEQ